MDRNWLKQYPPGVPADIDPDSYASLRDIFEEACATHGHSPAFTNMGATLTYAQLDELSRAFAAWLQKKSGLAPGDRVALMMPNILQYPIALFGVLRAGMVVVNTNPLYTARELEHQLKDSGAKAIVIVENFVHVLQLALPRTDLKKVLITRIGDLLGIPRGVIVNFVLKHVRKQIPPWKMPGSSTFKSALGAGLGLKLEPVPLGPEDIAFLQYTGGTTGIAKAAILTHRNMVANVLQASAWVHPSLKPNESRIVITALPLYHIFALTSNCLAFLSLGARNVLITNPRDFKSFVAELKKYKFNFMSGVNTLFNALLHTPGFETVDFSALRVTFAGGMALQGVVAARWKAVTGCIVTQGWGLTETAPGRHGESHRPRFQRLDRPSRSLDRHLHPRRCRQRIAGQWHRGDLRVRSAGDARLLESTGRNRESDVRRLASHRRHRPNGRLRLRVHRGSEERHDSGVRLQCLSE